MRFLAAVMLWLAPIDQPEVVFIVQEPLPYKIEVTQFELFLRGEAEWAPYVPGEL